jgi:hypothetical protein
VDRLAYSTVRIEGKLQNRETGTGTGFYYTFDLEGGARLPVIITTKHAIKGAVLGRLRFTTATRDGLPNNGNYFTFSLGKFEQRWIPHPDPDIDLCIMPMAPIEKELEKKRINIFYVPFDASSLLQKDTLESLGAIEDIIMVGYPNGIWDKTNNLPIFRKGITATHPKFDYNGKEEFLIDAACFPGSSGSPVLRLNGGLLLLGVLYAGPQYMVNGNIEIVNVPTVQKTMAVSRIPNNLGVVTKSKKIREFERILTPNVIDELSDFLLFHSLYKKHTGSWPGKNKDTAMKH